MGERFLVMGDNHGDTESLRRVLADTEGKTFDYVVHVGDFTRAMRHDDALGVRQLRESEPLLAELEERADRGFLWVWGNQDYFGDLDEDLDVGIEVPDDGCVSVGGRRFTNSPAHVERDVVLVTHMEHWRLVDHFDGRAHFCGNTHFGRHRGRRLNSAFLQATNPETREQRYGGYFVVDVDEDGLDVELRSIGDLERRTCDVHRERGAQFLPSDWPCMYAWEDEVLFREMAASAFYGATSESGCDTATQVAVVDHAVGLWDDPLAGFREAFSAYLDSVDDDRYAPLSRSDDGRLVVAERSYAY